ncbi:MAG: discoidin domain-containing protein [Lachnospiraceae bacterium]|nr:discoidin domain-containing protein [Lachnospiraceae bacterium]
MERILKLWRRGLAVLFAAWLFAEPACLVHAAESYQMVCDGDWSLLNNADMQAQMQYVFSQVYPRLVVRWGRQDERRQKKVRVQIVLQAVVGEKIVGGYTPQEQGSRERYIVIGAESNNRRQDRLAVLVHELGHVVECYDDFWSDWWTESLAEYSVWRYFNWTEPQFMTMNDNGNLFNVDLLDPGWKDWGWAAYGRSELFFTYMDSRYPTTVDASGKRIYGLIDAIHFSIQEGKIQNDKMDNPQFNAIVKKITGLDNMEQLRQQFVSELETGSWKFNGFAGYSDNVITENLPGVKNPSYPSQSFAGNLCNGAIIYRCSGASSEHSIAEFLVDNDLDTKWSAAAADANRQDEWLGKDLQHYVTLDLGNEVELDAYAIYHAGIKEDSSLNTVKWNVLYWDSAAQEWMTIDMGYVNKANADITTRVFAPIRTQILFFGFVDSDWTESGNVNIYEIVCMNTKHMG